jgi:hypothetical protein
MQNQSDSPALTMEAASGFLHFVIRIFSLPVTVLLHKGYGSRFVGLCGLLAFIPFFALVLFFPHSNPLPLMCLLGLYIGRVVVGRIAYFYQFFRGRLPKIHRQSPGYPLIARFLPDWSESRVLWLEPAGVFLLGLTLVWLTRPLGWYLILAAISMAAWMGLCHLYAMNQAMARNDAMLEQQVQAERFRELQGR